MSPKAHAKIVSMNFDAVRATPGVVAVFTADDIPGVNDCGPIIHDDPVLAQGIVQFVGQPMFIVVATSHDTARLAAIEFEDLVPVLTPADARKAESYVLNPLKLSRGDAGGRMAKAAHHERGAMKLGGQEQFYLEGQIAYAVPKDDDGMHVLLLDTASDGNAAPCRACAQRAFHNVLVECRRIGGGFGGKESQSGIFACCAALAAWKLLCPVKLRPDRDDDMMITGRSHDFIYEFEVGYDDGVSVDMTSRCGFSAGPVGPGDDTCGMPLRQRVLAVRREDRIHHGQRRAFGRPRFPRRAPRQSLRQDREQQDALRPDGRGQRHSRTDRGTRGDKRVSPPSRGHRRLQREQRDPEEGPRRASR